MFKKVKGWLMARGRDRTPITSRLDTFTFRHQGVLTRWGKHCAKSAEMVEKDAFETVVSVLTIEEGQLFRKLAYQGSLLGESEVFSVAATELLTRYPINYESMAKKLHDAIGTDISKMFLEDVHLFINAYEEALHEPMS